MKQQVSVAKLADYLKVEISYFFWFCMKSISSNSTFSLEATDSDKIPATGPERILQRTRKGQSSSTETADLELNLAQMFTWHYLLIIFAPPIFSKALKPLFQPKQPKLLLQQLQQQLQQLQSKGQKVTH